MVAMLSSEPPPLNTHELEFSSLSIVFKLRTAQPALKWIRLFSRRPGDIIPNEDDDFRDAYLPQPAFLQHRLRNEFAFVVSLVLYGDRSIEPGNVTVLLPSKMSHVPMLDDGKSARQSKTYQLSNSGGTVFSLFTDFVHVCHNAFSSRRL